MLSRIDMRLIPKRKYSELCFSVNLMLTMMRSIKLPTQTVSTQNALTTDFILGGASVYAHSTPVKLTWIYIDLFITCDIDKHFCECHDEILRNKPHDRQFCGVWVLVDVDFTAWTCFGDYQRVDRGNPLNKKIRVFSEIKQILTHSEFRSSTVRPSLTASSNFNVQVFRGFWEPLNYIGIYFSI